MTLQKQNFFGTNDAYIFDVKTERFVKVNSMNYARWYPTLAEMGNGMVMAMSGLNGEGQVTMNSEMFNPASDKWTKGPVPGVPDLSRDVPDRERAAVLHRLEHGVRPGHARLADARVLERARPMPSSRFPVSRIRRTWRPAPRFCSRPRRSRPSWLWAAAASAQSNSSTARTALIDVAAPDPHWVRRP